LFNQCIAEELKLRFRMPEHVSLWQLEELHALQRDTGGVLVHFPQCALAGRTQKWTTLMHSPALRKLSGKEPGTFEASTPAVYQDGVLLWRPLSLPEEAEHTASCPASPLHRRGHLRRRHRRRRLSLRRRHRLHRLHRLSRHEGTSTNLVEKVTPLAEAVGKNLVEKGTPLAEAVGKNGLTNAGTLVATGIVRGAGLLAAATICSTLITSRGLKKPR
jgi:hypothetical protein